MEKRLAIVSIVVKEKDGIEEVNSLLTEFSFCIRARLGLPYESRDIAIICIVVDAPMDVINSLTGKLGMIKGIKAKTLYE